MDQQRATERIMNELDLVFLAQLEEGDVATRNPVREDQLYAGIVRVLNPRDTTAPEPVLENIDPEIVEAILIAFYMYQAEVHGNWELEQSVFEIILAFIPTCMTLESWIGQAILANIASGPPLSDRDSARTVLISFLCALAKDVEWKLIALVGEDYLETVGQFVVSGRQLPRVRHSRLVLREVRDALGSEWYNIGSGSWAGFQLTDLEEVIDFSSSSYSSSSVFSSSSSLSSSSSASSHT